MTTKQDQIDKVRAYLTRMRETIAELTVYPRISSMFDTIVCAILSKTFSLADAALILIEAQHPEEAYGLVRSIVECALNLRYLTQDQSQSERETRAGAFANFFFVERQFWLHQAKEYLTDPEVLAEIDRYAAENKIVPDTKPAMQHWSGLQGFTWKVISMDHPLDGPTYEPKNRKVDYAIDYHQTSAYVSAGGQQVILKRISAYCRLCRLTFQ